MPSIASFSCASRAARIRGRFSAAGGFSLIELLVATAVMAMLLVMTLQVLSQTNAAIRSSDRQMGTASEVRGALDRLETDFSTAMLTGGATALVLDSNADNSFIRFICLSRAREDGTTDQPRGAIVGYGINDIKETIGGRQVQYGTLTRGDGRARFSATNSTLAQIFQKLSQSPPPSDFMKWEPLGSGLVRFHISYLLDDGSIVQIPPVYSMLSPQDNLPTSFLNGLPLNPGWMAVAFSRANAPASGRYVKALIVAVAGLSAEGVALAEQAGKLGEVTSKLKSPSGNETAMQVWETNLNAITFTPLRQGLRFYQRTIAVP
ncbi:MAG: prepilin-type N-terminal cleavage/methylation domain-containing protein [Verrucomicrobia bacterium]|nr:prepilin-type N-terminal cleavage/methylation domain-containing protein [Verrucomicrobiota bacterium]